MNYEDKIYACYMKSLHQDKFKVTEIWEPGAGFNNVVFQNLRLNLSQKYGLDIDLIKGSPGAKKAIVYQGSRYSYFTVFETPFHKDFKEKLRLLLEKINTLENRPIGAKPLDDESTIKFLYDSYAEGNSLKEIADKLNSSGVKTKRGGTWFKSTVKYMLSNKKYVQLGIVTSERFYLVRDLLKTKGG